MLKDQLAGKATGGYKRTPGEDKISALLNNEKLKAELGDKYEELGDMVANLQSNIKRLAEMAKRAKTLPIKMQHIQQYSKWDAIHEPYNVIENVLSDDEKTYKALTPNFDLTVDNDKPCYIASFTIAPGDCGPQTIELYVSNVHDTWTFVK